MHKLITSLTCMLFIFFTPSKFLSQACNPRAKHGKWKPPLTLYWHHSKLITFQCSPTFQTPSRYYLLGSWWVLHSGFSVQRSMILGNYKKVFGCCTLGFLFKGLLLEFSTQRSMILGNSKFVPIIISVTTLFFWNLCE